MNKTITLKSGKKFEISKKLANKLDKIAMDMVEEWVLFGMTYSIVSQEDLYESGELNKAEALVKMMEFISTGKYILMKKNILTKRRK